MFVEVLPGVLRLVLRRGHTLIGADGLQRGLRGLDRYFDAQLAENGVEQVQVKVVDLLMLLVRSHHVVSLMGRLPGGLEGVDKEPEVVLRRVVIPTDEFVMLLGRRRQLGIVIPKNGAANGVEGGKGRFAVADGRQRGVQVVRRGGRGRLAAQIIGAPQIAKGLLVWMGSELGVDSVAIGHWPIPSRIMPDGPEIVAFNHLDRLRLLIDDPAEQPAIGCRRKDGRSQQLADGVGVLRQMALQPGGLLLLGRQVGQGHADALVNELQPPRAKQFVPDVIAALFAIGLRFFAEDGLERLPIDNADAAGLGQGRGQAPVKMKTGLQRVLVFKCFFGDGLAQVRAIFVGAGVGPGELGEI